MRIPLIGSSASPYSLAAGAQQSMNCYVETLPSDEKNKALLRGRPGIRLFKDLTVIDAAAHPVRGLWSGGGRLFVAAGSKQFEVSSAGALVGTVHTISNTAGDPVTMIPNGNQLLILADGVVYCDNGGGPAAVTYAALAGNATTYPFDTSVLLSDSGDTFDVGMIGQAITYDGTGYTVASITNPTMLRLTSAVGSIKSNKAWSATPILTASSVAFLDGYYIASRTGTRQINISAHMDGTSWDALDTALKEGYPDNLVAVWAEPPLLYLLGTETLEVWRNTGAADFPLERVDGGFARVGCAGAWTMSSIMGKLHMLASGTYGGIVAVRMEGINPVRISTTAVEEAIRSASSITAYSYIERGHWFWVLNIGSDRAWVYDATESAMSGKPQWHERARWDGAAFQEYIPSFHTHLPEDSFAAGGIHIVGDGTSGKLYQQDSAFFDDDTTNIKYVRVLPYIYNGDKRIFHERIEFVLETGTAGTPLVVKLDWSDDNGQTFGSPAGVNTTITLGPGVASVYTTRYVARALGSSRGRIYRLSVTGQGKFALIDATLEVTLGTS